MNIISSCADIRPLVSYVVSFTMVERTFLRQRGVAAVLQRVFDVGVARSSRAREKRRLQNAGQSICDAGNGRYCFIQS